MLSGARDGDEICRYGGEEFLFILQSTEIAKGKEVAERVRAHIGSDAVHAGNKQLNISLSLGVAQAKTNNS